MPSTSQNGQLSSRCKSLVASQSFGQNTSREMSQMQTIQLPGNMTDFSVFQDYWVSRIKNRFRMHSSGTFQSELGLRIVGKTNAAFRYNRLSQDSPENASVVNILDLEYDLIKDPNLPHRINNLADAINNPVFSQT